ncbi:MAG: CoA transferase [Betaproteobacteria bacterium]|nr:CoA transferase [Betaproteobacteria bacterium]
MKVVEFAEGAAGPLAATRLADLGAAVIKIETAEGDWMRRAVPAMSQDAMSASFFHLNRGKRSLALGHRPAEAVPLLRALLAAADVFITDRDADELKRFGIGAVSDGVYADNPRLVSVHVSPLGRKGPMARQRGSELTVQAMAGYTRYLGTQEQPPLRLGADVASTGTGIFAAQAVLAALYRRNRDGRGQRVDLSLLNSLLSMKSIHLAAQSDPDVYSGPRVGGANNPPERGWKTADKPIFFAFGGSVGAEGRAGWVDFVKEAGFSRLLDDPRFDKTGRTTTGHGIRVHEVREEYEKEFARFPSEALVSLIRKHAGNVAAYMSADETMAHPQTAALGIVNEVETREGHKTRVRAFPARFSRLKPQTKGRAPDLGEQTEAIAAEAGITGPAFRKMVESGGLLPRAGDA